MFETHTLDTLRPATTSFKNATLFADFKDALREKLGADAYDHAFSTLKLSGIDASGVPHFTVLKSIARDWITKHHSAAVLEVWQTFKPQAGTFTLDLHCIGTAPAAPAKPATPMPAAPAAGKPILADPRALVIAAAVHDTLGGSPLDPRLTLSTFVEGRSNTLAIAATRQVALGQQGDLPMFNPLYLHGGNGRGKTHLLQAIAWAGNQSESRRVLYLTAEKFRYGFAAAIKSQVALAFNQALRGIDVLVIDDLQSMQVKAHLDELQHTIDALLNAGKQVVIAADRPPSDFENFSEALRSRLTGGLVVEIGPLDEPLRFDILKARATVAATHYSGFEVPDEVLSYVAHSVTHDGRDLEGALNRLLAKSRLNNQKVTLDMAEREIRDLIRPAEPRRIKIEDIQRVVARQYNVSRADLLSSRRTANVVRPRQVAMYLAKTLTLRSLPEIGRRFGGRDHTTVLHAVRKIEALIAKDPELKDEIDALIQLLTE